mmetsp:Transcript_24687/g.41737  ORF Transcript_24687/g.41737 Transcript_24687/m.41737 type:complete len:281 (+) Transcript_24687:39-881(+)
MLLLRRGLISGRTTRGFASRRASKQVAVVSTASRGLGLEFAKQLLDRNFHCILLVRSDAVPRVVQDLCSAYRSHCQVVGGLDLTNQESIENVCAQVGQLLQAEQQIRLLLNVAGVLRGPPGSPERSIKDISRSWLEKSLNVNFVGHCMVTQSLLPYLYQTTPDSSNGSSEYNCVCNISARVGSIGDNNLGGWYSYRTSKAALNMLTKTLALEVKRRGVTVLSLHPGTVDTDLSKPFQKNVKKNQLQTPQEAVQKMLEVILGMKKEDTGGFFAYDGNRIEW